MEINRKSKILFLILSIFLLLALSVLFFNPTGYLRSSYKTQTIIYRSKRNPNIRIEFQMQDIGAFGYKRRIVKISPGYFFDSVQDIDLIDFDTLEWMKVNEDVNELKLKGG